MNRDPDHKEENNHGDNRGNRTRYRNHNDTAAWPFILHASNDAKYGDNERWDVYKKNDASCDNY